MSRVVEHDHRSEILRQFGAAVTDGDVRAGTEDVGMPAREVHVVEPGQRPVPGDGLIALDRQRLEEPDGRRRDAAWRKRRRGKSSSRDQNLHLPRLISDSGISGGAWPLVLGAIPTNASYQSGIRISEKLVPQRCGEPLLESGHRPATSAYEPAVQHRITEQPRDVDGLRTAQTTPQSPRERRRRRSSWPRRGAGVGVCRTPCVRPDPNSRPPRSRRTVRPPGLLIKQNLGVLLLHRC